MEWTQLSLLMLDKRNQMEQKNNQVTEIHLNLKQNLKRNQQRKQMNRIQRNKIQLREIQMNRIQLQETQIHFNLVMV